MPCKIDWKQEEDDAIIDLAAELYGAKRDVIMPHMWYDPSDTGMRFWVPLGNETVAFRLLTFIGEQYGATLHITNEVVSMKCEYGEIVNHIKDFNGINKAIRFTIVEMAALIKKCI